MLRGIIDRSEKDYKMVTEEARRLQQQLVAIREVLQDNDIDKARERLAEFEDCSLVRTPTPRRGGNCQAVHSAGSLIEPENLSEEGSSEEGDSRGDVGCMRPPLTSPPVRRSARLRDMKCESLVSLDVNSNGRLENSRVSRKRMSSLPVDTYEDISFKRPSLAVAEADSRPVVRLLNSLRFWRPLDLRTQLCNYSFA